MNPAFPLPSPQALDVRVLSHPLQRHAVWLGGSVMAEGDAFHKVCHTREQYLEYGPRCVGLGPGEGEGVGIRV